MERYDVVVIGSGPAGYNTAIRAGQLGLRVACVERAPHIGGTGITGCIPSKALLHASEQYRAARSGQNDVLGFESVATLNLSRMMAYKTTVVDAVAAHVQSLLSQHGVSLLRGTARFAGPGRVIVRASDGTEMALAGRDIVIATGSEPVPLSIAAFDHERILDPADALKLNHVPRHLAVIGAGAVGVEIGSIWQRLGARVTLIESRERICHWLDREVAASLTQILRDRGMEIKLSAELLALERHADGVRLRLVSREEEGEQELDADVALIAVGRRPVTGGLDLDSVGLRPDSSGILHHRGTGFIAPGLWVVGDATTGPMLAHKAEEEAIACAEQIAGLPGFPGYEAIPRVIYTTPEVAMIGKTEDELRAAGIDYRIGRCPFAANARAATTGAVDGFVKLLVDTRTNLIVGAHIIGVGAGDLVSEVAVAIEASMLCEDLARTCHPHPTRSEALRHAAMAASVWMMQG